MTRGKARTRGTAQLILATNRQGIATASHQAAKPLRSGHLKSMTKWRDEVATAKRDIHITRHTAISFWLRLKLYCGTYAALDPEEDSNTCLDPQSIQTTFPARPPQSLAGRRVLHPSTTPVPDTVQHSQSVESDTKSARHRNVA